MKKIGIDRTWPGRRKPSAPETLGPCRRLDGEAERRSRRPAAGDSLAGSVRRALSHSPEAQSLSIPMREGIRRGAGALAARLERLRRAFPQSAGLPGRVELSEHLVGILESPTIRAPRIALPASAEGASG